MPTKAADFEMQDRLKALIHGNTGSGKSELAATAYAPLILLCEQQALRTIRRRNPEAHVTLIDTSEDLRKALADIKTQIINGDCPYDTVVIDSIGEVQLILKAEILKKSGRETLTVGEWGIIIDRVVNMVRAFRDLPLNILMLCRSEEHYVNDERFVRPSLSGKKLPNDVAGFFNVCGYQYKKQDDRGNIVHLTLFEGVEEILSKGDADLERVEIPHLPLWIRKMYGRDAKGACTDEDLEKLKLIGATETGHRNKPVGDIEAPADSNPETETKTEARQTKPKNAAAQAAAAAAAAAASN